jgi:hypothetical protein
MEMLIEHLTVLGWAEIAVKDWADWKFRCTYCDADMLECFDRYRLADADHILPKSKYPQLAASRLNLTLACGVCNRIKGRWDPNTWESPKIYVPGSELTAEQREALIERARRYVMERRGKGAAELDEMRRAVQEFRNRAIT